MRLRLGFDFHAGQAGRGRDDRPGEREAGGVGAVPHLDSRPVDALVDQLIVFRREPLLILANIAFADSDRLGQADIGHQMSSSVTRIGSIVTAITCPAMNGM